MMDPLTALGLASNIVQFVDYTRKLISGARELYVSSSGAKRENLELESIVRNIQELAERVRHGNTEQKEMVANQDKQLLDLSDQCVAVSTELLSVLDSLKVKGPDRSWESFHQAFKSQRKKGEIEGLQRRLDRISKHLNARALLDQQATVISKLHGLAAENRRLEINRTKELLELQESFSTIFHQIRKASQEDTTIRVPLRLLTLATDKGLGYSEEQSFLDFIRFDAIEDRQIAVRAAHHKTFSWIFRSSTSTDQFQSSANFVDWLASDHTLFWGKQLRAKELSISLKLFHGASSTSCRAYKVTNYLTVSGKPGSGKSTLMKFICEHEATKETLQTWANGQQLVVANFFFWNAGRQVLQRSQEGLLRSILYQILRQCPDLIPDAAARLSWNRNYSFEGFTTPKLLSVFGSIATHLTTSKFKFCFFIDGLDEYEGKPDTIIQLVELLKSALQVKFCVSSRPWNEFEKAFGQDQSKKLYMQELTRADIKLYVRDTLENDTGFQELKQRDHYCPNLVQDVVDAAEGVFLWVFLVVRSLLEGLTNADRIVDLQRRLRDLPTDLNEYFERILFTVDNFYRKETAQMFQVTLMAHETLSLMAYWFMDQDDPTLLEDIVVAPLSIESINNRQNQMQKRLNACCKGLLEAQFTGSALSSVVPLTPKDAFFSLKVEFLHRTVRDFLRIPEMVNMVNKWVGTVFDENTAICEAIVCQIKSTPQHKAHFMPGGSVSGLLDIFFYHIKILDDGQCPVAREARLLDELERALQTLGSEVTKAKSVLSSSRRIGTESEAPAVSVLEEAAQIGLKRYISLKLDQRRMNPETESTLLLSALLPTTRHSNPDPRLEIVPLLLKAGFDPNGHAFRATIPERQTTVWTSYLKNEYKLSKANENTDFDNNNSIIKELLEHGADPHASWPLTEMGDPTKRRQKAADVVKFLVTGLDPIEQNSHSKAATNKLQESKRKRLVKAMFGKRDGR
jgi:hypothetical protein